MGMFQDVIDDLKGVVTYHKINKRISRFEKPSEKIEYLNKMLDHKNMLKPKTVEVISDVIFDNIMDLANQYEKETKELVDKTKRELAEIGATDKTKRIYKKMGDICLEHNQYERAGKYFEAAGYNKEAIVAYEKSGNNKKVTELSSLKERIEKAFGLLDNYDKRTNPRRKAA